MLELLRPGGFIMIPLLVCSIMALAIVIERFWTLRNQRIAPTETINELWRWIKRKELNARRMKQVQESSPLGQILVAGLMNAKHGRDVMKDSIEQEASRVVHELERFLNPLGTIAVITPLLGLLGTVIGMIKVFAQIQMGGVGDPGLLAGGISEALITTAAGLTIAIPALIFHRFFLRRVDEMVVSMEQEAVKLVEVVHGDREIKVEGA
ncbi:MAG: MotA/TolQ/ExbB proton channel family protein [Halomonadaceae bacterium]|nr:MAG: MotA/TolQ/ExbB proton channel family protein [Halomonadaceae bacterium]